MKQLLYFTSFLLVITSASIAQDSTIALRRTPRAIIKFAPLSLLDQDATIQAGLEYQIKAGRSVQVEGGYGWRSLSAFKVDLDDFVRAEVWRVRSEVRFYTGRYRTNRRQGVAVGSSFPLGNYWAIDGLFKQINVVGKEYDPQSIFSSAKPELLGLKRVSRYVLGTHLKIGRQFAFYDPYKHLFSRTLLDVYVGAGARWAINDIRRYTAAPDYPCGCGFGRSFDTQGGQWTPSLTAGLKVGFAL